MTTAEALVAAWVLVALAILAVGLLARRRDR